MLDVLEAGCITLQQRSSELEAALIQARTDVTPVTEPEEEAPIQEEAPKRQRAPAKRKSKGTKARRSTAKKKKVAAKVKKAAATVAEPSAVSGPPKEKEDETKRGKRQALGMSFSALRAAIQSRRGVRRGEEVASDQTS